jgi:hypothetical protein
METVQILIKERVSMRSPQGGSAGNPNGCCHGKLSFTTAIRFACVLVLAFAFGFRFLKTFG